MRSKVARILASPPPGKSGRWKPPFPLERRHSLASSSSTVCAESTASSSASLLDHHHRLPPVYRWGRRGGADPLEEEEEEEEVGRLPSGMSFVCSPRFRRQNPRFSIQQGVVAADPRCIEGLQRRATKRTNRSSVRANRLLAHMRDQHDEVSSRKKSNKQGESSAAPVGSTAQTLMHTLQKQARDGFLSFFPHFSFFVCGERGRQGCMH